MVYKWCMALIHLVHHLNCLYKPITHTEGRTQHTHARIEHRYTHLRANSERQREREQEQEEEVIESIDLSCKLENSIEFLQSFKKRALSFLDHSQLVIWKLDLW